jgi:hypothetical protein
MHQFVPELIDEMEIGKYAEIWGCCRGSFPAI